jgi:TolB-like protein
MMRSIVRYGAGLATALVALSSAGAQPANAPIVAVWPFEASGIGMDVASMKGGLQELTIIDLANSSRVRVVERGRLNELMAEQNLARTGAVDAATAVKLGKLWGVHYFVTGSIVVTQVGGRTQMKLTARTVNAETGQVGNPQTLTEGTDDIFGSIGRLNAKFIADLKVTNLGGNAPAPAPAKSASATQQSAPPAGTTAGKTANGTPVLFRAAMPESEQKATKAVTLDVKTALLYSKGIEALDVPDKRKAADLFKQVLAAEKDFLPAQEALKKAGS